MLHFGNPDTGQKHNPWAMGKEMVAKFGKHHIGGKMDIKTPTLADNIVSNKDRYYGAGDRSRFASFFPSAGKKDICSNQFKNWLQQVSTGHLH